MVVPSEKQTSPVPNLTPLSQNVFSSETHLCPSVPHYIFVSFNTLPAAYMKSSVQKKLQLTSHQTIPKKLDVIGVDAFVAVVTFTLKTTAFSSTKAEMYYSSVAVTLYKCSAPLGKPHFPDVLKRHLE